MKKILLTIALTSALFAQAEVMDRPSGFKIGQRMTVRPYVSMAYTYDSNVNSRPGHGTSGSSWVISPGFSAEYKAENWNLKGGAYYQYHAYSKNSNNLNSDSYGQNLGFNWANSRPDERGWSLILRESFAQISQDDDMSNHNGRGVGRDRKQFQFSAGLQRRITERWHADVEGTYYYLDYDNNNNKYAPMYGWRRWTAGGQIGYAASKWTDFIVAANYQNYRQDNHVERKRPNGTSWEDTSGGARGRHYDPESKGWTIQAGIGTHATERISYRLTGGWSFFEFGGGAKDVSGFSYQASSSWQMTDRWTMMMLASSYFQPSEQEYGGVVNVHNASWGVGHSMIRGKLNTTFDLNYRHESREYTEYYASEYDQDIFTGRIGLNYTINRFIVAFTNLEYQKDWIGGNQYKSSYDYDRWRLTVGLRLTY